MRPSRRPRTTGPLALAAALIVLTIIASATLVRAFAEEPIRFRDPPAPLGEHSDEEISTIHDDLTYLMALAAGFSITDSNTLRVWNQLVDSEQLGAGASFSYTNCSGAFYPSPVPTDVCPGITNTQVAWPLWGSMKDPATCVTSRFGPYSPFFHFPRLNTWEMQSLHDWGWGITDTLWGYEAYAWGGATVMQATCRYTHTVAITTGIPAGSLPAFATYLHCLGDAYSHRDCIAVMDAMGMPWATHTLPPFSDIYECNYNPWHHTNTDAHGREFGTQSMTDSLRTDEAARAIYGELVARSRQREGQYVPLTLDTPISGTETLSDVLYAFVHNWEYNQPLYRRAYADQAIERILALRQPRYRLYLPLVMKGLVSEQEPGPGEPSEPSQTTWGQLKTWPGVTTTHAVYEQSFVYGDTPLLIADTRYADRTCYETRALTVYRAHDGAALREQQPVVFYVHGGGWTSGYRDEYDFVPISFTGEKGWTTVVIDYRLTSDQVFLAARQGSTCAVSSTKAAWYPDNIQDVAAAFQWTVDHIAANGGDPARIVVFGHSAGGHLAALLATHPDYASLRPSIRGVVSMSGAYELTTLDKLFWATVVNQTFPGGIWNNDAELAEASPSTYAGPGSALPPFFLLYARGELPSLTEQNIAFKNKLSLSGYSVDIAYLAGYDHVSEMAAIADINQAPTALIVAFIENTVGLRVYCPLIVRVAAQTFGVSNQHIGGLTRVSER